MLFIVAGLFLATVLMCCAIVLVGDFRDGLSKQAIDAANHYSEKWQKLLNDELDFFIADATEIANGLPSGEDQTVLYFHDMDMNADGIQRYVRFFDSGKEYNEMGILLDKKESAHILEMAENNVVAVSGIISDSYFTSNTFAVYVPAPAGSEIDGIAVFYAVDALKTRLQNDIAEIDAEELPDYLCACSYDGYIFVMLNDSGLNVGSSSNYLYTELTKLTNDKTSVNEIQADLGNNKTFYITVSGNGYAVTLNASEAAGNAFYMASLYDVHDVYAEGHELASTIGAIIITVMLITITLGGYLIMMRLGIASKMDEYDTKDQIYGCLNINGFQKKTEEILYKNKVTKFAVVYSEIAHYSYIEEHFGAGVADSTLKYLVKIYDKSFVDDEVYGRINDDHFVFIMHYSDIEALEGRLKTITALAYNCPALKEQNYYLSLNFGLYLIDRENKEENLSIQTMIDRATIASHTSLTGNNSNIRVYSEEIHQTFMHEAEIESKMDAALANGEFKIFYQPKYKIAGNKIDGCEALVRWYDAKNNRFRPPSEFLPLFERNGFIEKLDHYVFTEVCKFIEEMRNQNYRLVPISVNVSRNTAIQPGFLDFYINTKRQFGISERFIMIEFTESFAYEDYDVIKDFVDAFHRNGFRCSIDDFGSGFSSYNILKELPMDEIKLDRFFIQPGVSRERDDKLLSSVITLAKAMNMMVTQEGVETVEDLKRLRDMGCDVVQGYVYSRPLPATDFLDFIQSGGSIRIV